MWCLFTLIDFLLKMKLNKNMGLILLVTCCRFVHRVDSPAIYPEVIESPIGRQIFNNVKITSTLSPII